VNRRFVILFAVIVAASVVSPLTVAARAGKQTIGTVSAASGARTSLSTSPVQTMPSPVTAVVTAAPRDSAALVAALQQVVAGSGATVGVSVVELGGQDPITWSLDAGTVFTAASTYKLAALMMEAMKIAAGTTDPNGLVCYQESDYEAGWFDDYAPGVCFTRNELASRAAKQSDNTAGHMLVRDLGGAAVLNAWTASVGTTSSAFFEGNTTTAGDLAALWVAEASGDLGGAAAQAWLYPLLTRTTTESGIPAGVPAGATVVHKTGTIDAVNNDAALVMSGPDGAYVLTVMTDGLGGALGWGLIASASAAVWQAELARTQ
jgi:beta-lactamase class A